MKKIFSACVMVAIFFICGAVSAAEISNSGSIEIERVYYVKEGQSLNEAQRIAEIIAKRAMAEEIGDLYVTSTSTVNQLCELYDEIALKVAGIINGVHVTINRQADGNFIATAKLPVFGGNRLANVVLPANNQVEDFPKPKFANLESGNFEQNYTGLIVDCGGQNLSTAVAPTIKSVSGTEIYSFKNVQRQIAVNRGIAGYADSTDSGVQRAGNNPLIVTAVFVENCDAVVSDEDADRILAANQKSNFLSNCLVVFVR